MKGGRGGKVGGVRENYYTNLTIFLKNRQPHIFLDNAYNNP